MGIHLMPPLYKMVISPPAPPVPTTITIGIQDDDDDVTYYDMAGIFSKTDDNHVGWGFEAGYCGRYVVPLDKGTTIQHAYIRGIVHGGKTGRTVNSTIKCEQVDDAAQIASKADWASRTMGAAVNWDGITNWTDGQVWTSPDIKDIVQTILNRAGWVNGNHINIEWYGKSTSDETIDTHSKTDGMEIVLILTYLVP